MIIQDIFVRSKRLRVGALVLGLAFCVLLNACQGRVVRSISWFDAQGKKLEFAVSTQGGSETGFGSRGEKKRYILNHAITLPDGVAAQIMFSFMGSSTQFQIAYGDEKGRGDSFLCTIPATGRYAFLVPPTRSHSLKWIEIKLVSLSLAQSVTEKSSKKEHMDAQNPVSEPAVFPLMLEGIKLVPGMRGVSIEDSITRISTDFVLTPGKDNSRYEIRNLPSDSSGQMISKLQLEVSIEGVPSNVSIYFGNKDMIYRHTGGSAKFILPYSLLGNNSDIITMEAPSTLRINRFCVNAAKKSDELDRIDPGFLVQQLSLGNSEYYSARWDAHPDTLLFLFNNYETQDHYLKRLAFFIEKIGYVGRLAQDSEIASLHGWNAHDYKAEDLARFFGAAAAQQFPLSREELALRDFLLKQKIIIKQGASFLPGKGAIVSITQESPRYLQYRFLSHELSHALFFNDARYRDLAISLYDTMSDQEKWFLIRYFRWMGYNVDSSYLMANEMQAYLMQQPIKELSRYFKESLGKTLSNAHPELANQIDEYMQENFSILEESAQKLGAYLKASYGFEPGMLFKIR